MWILKSKAQKTIYPSDNLEIRYEFNVRLFDVITLCFTKDYCNLILS